MPRHDSEMALDAFFYLAAVPPCRESINRTSGLLRVLKRRPALETRPRHEESDAPASSSGYRLRSRRLSGPAEHRALREGERSTLDANRRGRGLLAFFKVDLETFGRRRATQTEPFGRRPLGVAPACAGCRGPQFGLTGPLFGLRAPLKAAEVLSLLLRVIHNELISIRRSL